MNTTPSDYIGIGLAVAVVGAVIAGFVAAATGMTGLLWLATAPAFVGCVIAQIGIVAWGVRAGMRAARVDEWEAGQQSVAR